MDQNLTNIHPEIARAEKSGAAEFLSICNLWKVKTLDSKVDNPIVSSIPTLILSGYFDPITPPSYGETVAQTLSKRFVFVVPTGGHGQAFESECLDNIILSFLEDPSRAPDASCLNGMEAPEFYTSTNVIDIPGLIRILNLEGSAGIEMLILLIALLVLGSAFLILPLTWLVSRLRKKSSIAAPVQTTTEASLPSVLPATSSKPLLTRTSNWLAILTGFILWVFIIGLIAVLVEMVINNDNRLFFGVPSMLRGWFVLPVFALLFGIGMVLSSMTAWIKSNWSIWMRLYYSLITIAALSSLFILGKWGILTALL
jgi:hypothetical protein